MKYIKKGAVEVRKKLFELLKTHLKFEIDEGQVIESSDSIDAAICVLAGYDFLMKSCIPPKDREMAQKEGWVWIRHPIK